MKIGIVTITNNGYNYGNQLQNYAVKRIYEELGCTVKTLYNIDGSEYQVSLLHRLKNYFFIITKHPSWPERLREEKFRKFGKKYLSYTSPFTFDTVNLILKEKFDYISVGSDQVWNPYFECNNIHLNYLLLSFVEPSKRIAFSASMGITSFPKTMEENFQSELSLFKAISVREFSAQQYLDKILNKKVCLLIDPTLMLNRKEWMKLSSKPSNFNDRENYILTYFLGEKPKLLKYDLECLKENNLKVYHFFDKNMPEMITYDPCEFIYMISHAKCILTDSFHASVFSFIFGISFYVYERIDNEKNMLSRFDTFLKKFNLQNHYRLNNKKINIEPCDFTEGYELLKLEKEKVKNFLKKALDE